MEIKSVFDAEFSPYGQVHKGYKLDGLLAAMKAIPLPESGTTYQPAIPELEALPIFEKVGLGELVLGRQWMPIDFTGVTSFGIFNFLAATIYVSVVGMALALLVGLGAALYLSCQASDRVRGYLYPVIDLLAGIPSVIYGFIGLVTLGPAGGDAAALSGLLVQ